MMGSAQLTLPYGGWERGLHDHGPPEGPGGRGHRGAARALGGAAARLHRAQALTVELIDWIKKGSPLPILPLCYWEWFIMYSPALLTIVQ